MANEVNNVPGGWKLAETMKPCNLPEKVATGFAEVTQTVGAKYVPVLYVGTQTVHGVNHMVICKQTLSTEGAEEHLVKMVLNQNLDDGSLVGKWSLISIKQIV